jgi:hypothetical protein
MYCVCPYLRSRSDEVFNEVKPIVQRFNEQPHRKVIMEVVLVESLTRMTDRTDPCIDTNQQVLYNSNTDDGEEYSSWPPVGLNLVYSIPRDR